MNFINQIPGLDLNVSALGLGTVKLGRDQGVKYPNRFSLPNDKEIKNLFSIAKENDINLIDTAPAYGCSEDRIGKNLSHRHDWVICTKVGEEFDSGQSSFDFSASHTKRSIERSLRRLQTDFLDIVLIHSNGDDLEILQKSDCLQTLQHYKQKGLIRAIGMSTKTIEGGILAAKLMDIVMITYNLEQQDQAVLDFSRNKPGGVFIKKGFMSGHIGTGDAVQNSLEFILKQDGIHSMIVGTINPEHLQQNIQKAKKILC